MVSCNTWNGNSGTWRSSNLNSLGTNKQLFVRLDNKNEKKKKWEHSRVFFCDTLQPLYVRGLFPGGAERVYKSILVGNNNSTIMNWSQSGNGRRMYRQIDKYVQGDDNRSTFENVSEHRTVSTDVCTTKSRQN